MGLTLVTGRANTGKTGVVHAAVRDAADAGRAAALLLPTAPDVARATEEFALSNPLGLRVEQIDRWIASMWSLHGDGRRHVEPPLRALLLAEATERSRLRTLDVSSRTRGFRSLMTYVTRMAAEQGPEAITQAVPRGAADAEALSVLRLYLSLVEKAGLIEPAHAALALAGTPPRTDGPIFAHRFTELTPSQERLLTALAAREDVMVSLPWEEGFPATSALDGLMERLSRSGRHIHCPVPPQSQVPELAKLEAGLFQAPATGAPGGAVQFCTATGIEAEAALIAARAADAAARFGPDRVAIVFREASRHVEHVARALAGAGVQADLDVIVPAVGSPFGRALTALMQWSEGGDPKDLVRFLRGPFSGAAPDAVDRLEARWRGSTTLDARKVAAEAVNAGKRPNRALRLAARVCGEGLPADWQELAGVLLGAAHRVGGADAGPAEADSSAHRTLLEIVNGVASARAGGAAATVVMDLFGDGRAAAGTSGTPGHVQVTEAHRLRSRRFDVVIVGGMTAGGFSAEGRVSAAAELADRLCGVDGRDLQAAERLLFYDVCTRARRQLVLTRQTADSDGTALRASVFWEEALDLYRPPAADADGEAEASVVSHALRLSDLERAAPALTPGRTALREAVACGGDAGRGAVARARDRRRARGGRLEDPEVLSVLAAHDEFSATELETYARCPYRWFYERAVRPRALDAAFDARGRGDLAHRALAAFYAHLEARLGVRRVTPDVLGPALSWMEEAFDTALADARTPGRRTLIEEDGVVRARAWVRDLVVRDQHFLPAFTPRFAEARFGRETAAAGGVAADTADPGGAVAPAGLGPVDLGGFLLKGSIDRIDEGPNGLVVIDYKTGGVPKKADLERDRVLQVPLYVAAAQALTGMPVVAGLYRGLRDGTARGFWLADVVDSPGLTSTDKVEHAEEITAIVTAATSIAREAAAGIRAGAIEVAPCGETACTFCAAALVCGREVAG
jgi:ATP-dependent helicase/nuclease subunit B